MKEIYKIPKGQNVATSKGWKHIDTEIKDFVYETEQVPETFEELKELCKDIKDIDIEEADDLDVARIIIHSASLIYFEDELLIVAGFKRLKIKPAQMWNIIKNLIGAEKWERINI